LTSLSIFGNREIDLPYSTYVVSHYLCLLDYRDVFVASLYYLGKYDVIIAIIVVFYQTRARARYLVAYLDVMF